MKWQKATYISRLRRRNKTYQLDSFTLISHTYDALQDQWNLKIKSIIVGKEGQVSSYWIHTLLYHRLQVHWVSQTRPPSQQCTHCTTLVHLKPYLCLHLLACFALLFKVRTVGDIWPPLDALPASSHCPHPSIASRSLHPGLSLDSISSFIAPTTSRDHETCSSSWAWDERNRGFYKQFELCLAIYTKSQWLYPFYG